MLHNERTVFLPCRLVDHPDGSVEWRPDTPATTRLDSRKFEEELALAARISEVEGCEIWWMHNGIRISSDIIYWSTDPWAWLTEQNSVMAN